MAWILSLTNNYDRLEVFVQHLSGESVAHKLRQTIYKPYQATSLEIKIELC
jgi:hypothetical protein